LSPASCEAARAKHEGQKKFLTPAGMKTLFPIFENTLCGKVLAGKTRTPIFKKTKDV